MNKQIVVIIVAVLFIAGIVGFLIGRAPVAPTPALQESGTQTQEQQTSATQKTQTTQPKQTAPTSLPKVSTAGWKTYEDVRNGFSFNYPAEYPVSNLPLREFRDEQGWIDFLVNILAKDSVHQNIQRYSFVLEASKIKDLRYDLTGTKGDYYYYDVDARQWKHRVLQDGAFVVKDETPQVVDTTKSGHRIYKFSSPHGPGVVDENYIMLNPDKGVALDFSVSDTDGFLGRARNAVPALQQDEYDQFQEFYRNFQAVVAGVKFF